MSFFYVRNLTEQTLLEGNPWEFQPTETISQQIRHDKVSRQDFYRTASTQHHFYAGIEPANPNQRTSKTNPPRRIHAICVDFDLPLTPERVNEAIEKMTRKPSWVERSLGGNCRLIWVLSLPLLVDSTEFAQFVLQESKKWLQMELLPGLDDGALTDPMRLLCNGCDWKATVHPSIPENDCQAFYVKCGAAFRFTPITAAGEIPLDLVEKALKEKFPTFSWPGPFDVDTQGPSFWVEGSTSPMSAIVKKDGMFSFSDHAEKPFFYWGDILGKEFAQKYETNALAEATKNIFFDGKMYWVMNDHEGHFIAMSKDALQTRLKVDCRVSPKPDKTGTSMMDRCLNHINNYGHVSGGAPVLFHEPGMLEFAGMKVVNTASKSKIIIPCGIPTVWGPEGKFPFLSQVFDGLFDPTAQLEYFLAWLRYFYVNALKQTPKPGQNLFIAGGPGVGKTLMNRTIIGGLMGGHTDAARFMVGDGGFNSSLFHSAVWSVDDETISDSESAHRRFSSYIKLAAANQSFNYRKKFEHELVIPWQGRVIVTLNLDDASSRSLPALDGTILDKVSFFRGVAEPKFRFPDRDIIVRLVREEMPHFAQWLVNWETPEHLIGEARYGVKAHHEPTLISRAHQSSKSSPFKEIVVDFLARWFVDNPKALEYRASVTQLMRGLHSDPLNDAVMRSLKLEQCNRYLETLSKEGVLKCRSETGDRQTRIWSFDRLEELKKTEATPEIPPMTACSIFTR